MERALFGGRGEKGRGMFAWVNVWMFGCWVLRGLDKGRARGHGGLGGWVVGWREG